MREKLYIQTEDGVREYTEEEYAINELDKEAEKLALQLRAEAEAKRLAALAKLEALGLTAEDLKAIGL